MLLERDRSRPRSSIWVSILALLLLLFFVLVVPWLSVAEALRRKPQLASTSYITELQAVNQNSPNFPGPHGRVTRGLAFSGGGSRALSWAMGGYRALESLGLMQKVDAISSISGGTWASSLYMFANISATELLGQPTQPSQLTLAELGKTNGKMSDAVKSGAAALIALYVVSKPGREVWERVVSEKILKPFGLNKRESLMAADAAQVSSIRSRNPQLGSKEFLTPQAGKPKAFIMGGMLWRPAGKKSSLEDLVSLQMSPDYSGSPFWPGGQGNTFEYPSKSVFGSTLKNVTLGGGFVESFAFGSRAPTMDSQSNGGQAQMEAPSEGLSLPLAVAVSSSMEFEPQRKYFPVMPSGKRQEEIKFEINDGGIIENSGLMALLQRGATKAAIWVATSVPIDDSVDFCSLSGSGLDSALAGCGGVGCTLTSFFGIPYVDDTYFYNHNEVFEKSALQPLLCDLQKLKKAGKPTVDLRTYKVLRNDWWGISGGFSVKLLVVMLDRCTDFENSLPSDTRAAIEPSKADKDDIFMSFPQYGTTQHRDPMLLKVPETNLLAAQSEYFVRQNMALFREILG